MSARDDGVIVIPGDVPPRIQGSPHLERLRHGGDVRLYADRPASLEERIARSRDARPRAWICRTRASWTTGSRFSKGGRSTS